MTTPRRPIIGITPDTHTHKEAWRYEVTREYAACIEAAGGVPIILPYQTGSIDAYLGLCDAVVLGGGDDPDTRAFGQALHPAAKRVVAERQTFELALLAALDHTDHPVLGICLGMQWMALHHGGRLHQDLAEMPDLAASARRRHDHAEHEIVASPDSTDLAPRCRVFSRHHQAVADAGRLRVIARSDEASGALIEAIDLPGGRFYLGVQWHPERTADPAGGPGIFGRLMAAARRPASAAIATPAQNH